jgi:hypothetical protein
VQVAGSGTFNMSGGAVISDTKATGETGMPGGGGVYVTGSGSIFNMGGGEISGNDSKANPGWGGGGVYVDGSIGGNFRMANGIIYGVDAVNEEDKNTAAEGAAVYWSGGGGIKLGTFAETEGIWDPSVFDQLSTLDNAAMGNNTVHVIDGVRQPYP